MMKQETRAVKRGRLLDYAPRPGALALAGLAGFVVALAALSVGAHSTPYWSFDLAITQAVQSIHAGWFDLLMRAISWPGYPPQIFILLVPFALLLWFKVGRWEAICFLIGAAVVGTLGTVIKMPVDRMRPPADLVYVATPGLDGGKWSFPAGHVAGNTTLVGFAVYLLWRVRQRAVWQTVLMILLIVSIPFIGLSRIYMGEHWFSDVIGGYLTGLVVLWLTIYIYEWGRAKYTKEKASSK